MTCLALGLTAFCDLSAVLAADSVNYQRDIAPILTKYCTGCHNSNEAEGDIALDSLPALLKGTEEGQVVIKGNAGASKLLKLITGDSEPTMPPDDEPAPSSTEINLIRDWIEQGLAAGGTSPTEPAIKLQAAPEKHQLVGAATVVGEQMIVGRLGTIEASDIKSRKLVWRFDALPGKVNAIRPSNKGTFFAVGSGIAGVSGEVVLIDRAGKELKRFKGHTDAVYSVAISPDAKWIASGSYDRTIILWDAKSGDKVSEFNGHNGAIYDLDFDPSGQVLASASGDQTVKLWNIDSGKRLDTFGQPEGEMYCVRFSQDGKAVFAAGADKQLRKWQLNSKTSPALNPMLLSRYAHEAAILLMQVTEQGIVLTSSEDKSVKAWEPTELSSLGEIAKLTQTPVAVCFNGNPGIAVGLQGEVKAFEKTSQDSRMAASRMLSETPLAGADEGSSQQALSTSATALTMEESEPNDDFSSAAKIDIPVHINGVISETTRDDVHTDVDLFRFSSEAGQTWLFDVTAASNQSKLDSLLDIFDEKGAPVMRTRLQAVRETYFTFRGKNGDTSDDFRLHKWEDMGLDEFIYANGEINKLWHYPRGPDSGFRVYPGVGTRHTFFDTTPLAHALGEPAYIVRELAPDEDPLPNGLPVFPLYYENDDDSLRRHGKDSRLTFTAPRAGDYFVRIRDARGFGGSEYKYKLSIRQPKPSFTVATESKSMKMPVGSGREWQVTATRLDGFSGPISVYLEGLPDNYSATNPVIIEGNQITAFGTIFLKQQPSSGTDEVTVKLRATAMIDGVEVSQTLEEELKLSISDAAELQFQLVSADTNMPIDRLTVQPGQTITAKIIVQRNGVKSRIGFGSDDAGRNLPHGAYVDNIGLNGLLIPEDQTEREFFITADKKVSPGRRQFHLKADTKGKPTSRPIWINVQR